MTPQVIKIRFRLRGNFCATHGGTDCKELEIETADKMEIVFRRLLDLGTNVTAKSFIMMYLNQPRPSVLIVTFFVQIDTLSSVGDGRGCNLEAVKLFKVAVINCADRGAG